MSASFAYTQFQSLQGPTDSRLEHTTLDGYQPVSRIGEVVINAFVDAHEYAALKPSLTRVELDPTATIGTMPGNAGLPPGAPDGGYSDDPAYKNEIVEHKPHFHEWASVTPGMICLSRKARNATFRNYVAAETATPVVGCAACLPTEDAKQFYFAGICRSKTIRPIDDGVGPSVDEFFTLAIGGMATLQNNSKDSVFPGDMIEWTLYGEANAEFGAANDGQGPLKRQKTMPRRVSIKVASPTSEPQRRPRLFPLLARRSSSCRRRLARARSRPRCFELRQAGRDLRCALTPQTLAATLSPCAPG